MSNSSEILAILEYMEKEKQISRADMIDSITAAIRNAAAKSMHAGYDLKIEINPKSGALKSWALLTVTDSVADPATQIHIDKAKLYKKDPQIGDIVEREIDLSNLGRIAAKNVYQSIIQKVRLFEKERIFDDYKGSVGDIVTGTVRRREKGAVVIDLGKAEAIMPKRESVLGEDYAPGERIRCLLLEIDNSPRGPEIILSRASYKFVRRLFELEVTEMADGSVKIEAMSRDPGYRTKIAVSSSDPRIDPVGACVGAGGSRVKSIVRELNGEKVDVIKYSPDPVSLLEECIKPAAAKNVRVNAAEKKISFEVSEDDLSIVIGKRGSNAKLTSRLLGWKLEISKEASGEMGLEQRVAQAAGSLSQILSDLSEDQAAILANNGITSADAFEGVEVEDLAGMGFAHSDAEKILARVREYLQSQ
ncbi:MAG: transcription termination/antitermination protein NusA [Verrucomicrobia bacterium]|nr:MAG: transcription termination/antitermination protein NusA [Verrucomicrobiota bacterium]